MKIYSRDEVLKASTDYFQGDDLAAEVFTAKYALRDDKLQWLEDNPDSMHQRMAGEFARIEKKYKNPLSKNAIYSLLKDFQYVVPGGSPMFGIGNPYQRVSLSNCFVIKTVDSYGGICRADERVAQISKRRGGVGIDISPIRPRGVATGNCALTTDGITVFMERFSNTSQEVAQCISEGERVLTDKGLVNIEDICSGQKVWTKEGWVGVVNKVESGNKKIFKMTTKCGYSIRTSEDHIFTTSIDGDIEEIKLKDLNVGDEVVLLCGTEDAFRNKKNIKLDINNNYQNENNKPNNCELPAYLDEKLAYILGYSYGDGSVEKNKINEPRSLSLACSNKWEEIISKLMRYVYEVFKYQPTLRKGSGDLKILTIDNKCISNFLQQNNILKQKSGDIQFPSVIVNSPIKTIFSFLSGYFDADGSVTESKKMYRFHSINYGFLSQIQIILMSVGIPSKISKEKRKEEKWEDIYTLNISGAYAKGEFIRLMQQSVKVASFKYIPKRDCWLTPFKPKTLNINYGKYNYCGDNTQFISASTFKRLKADGNDLPELLIKDLIVKIEEDGVDKTYDLQLESEHLFWCEGFYVHNSGRRGALMQTISVHHPEIMNFIRIKRDRKRVTGANISVRVTDEFMEAVKKNKTYELRWPTDSKDPVIKSKIKAREVWHAIIESVHDSAEPGILFWDNIIRNSPADCYSDLGFETSSTNPCGELPLCELDSCRLMSINLSSYVIDPFTENARFNEDLFKDHVGKAMRLMDDLVDLELEAITKIIDKVKSDPEDSLTKSNEMEMWSGVKKKCEQGRRTGLGITALGDCIAMLNVKYGDDESIKIVDHVYSILRNASYGASIQMAKERGAFPIFDTQREKGHEYLERLPDDIREDMAKYGRRNIGCLTTAPAGSISTVCRTTSGFEPIFKVEYFRKRRLTDTDKDKPDLIDDNGNRWKEYKIIHSKAKIFEEVTGKKIEESPYYGAQCHEIDYAARVQMQATATKYVDHAISSTVNLPEDIGVDIVEKIYFSAWEKGCKGLTVYREKSREGILTAGSSITRSCQDCDQAGEEFARMVSEGMRPKKIIQAAAPSRPQSLECDIHRSKVDKGDWLFFVGKLNGKVYEVFGGDSEQFTIPHKYRKGWILKNGKVEGVTQYNLVLGSLEDENEKLEVKGIAKHFNNYQYGAFTRLISLAIRHGTPIKYICEQITKTGVEGELFSFQRAMSRVLKKYIGEGEKSDANCPQCGSEDVYYKNGCPSCRICGHSNCS